MGKGMKISIHMLVVALFAVNVAQAADGDPAAGKEKSVVCQGCHGENGMSVNPMCPNLAGQFPRYLEKQIRDFQTEKRTDPIMTGMAMGIEEAQDARDIAAYFASQKRMIGSSGKGNKKGEIIFHQGNPETGLYACANCHGETGKGKSENNNVFPVIGGQTKDYIVKQLKDLRDGTRHNDPAGMMGNIAKKMSDEEIDAVAEYAMGL